MHLASKEIFAPTPAGPGITHGQSFYTQKTGVEKIKRVALETRSDLLDATHDSYSSDNGKTWGEAIIISGDGKGGDLGYPSTVELPDSTLLTVWYEVPKGTTKSLLRRAKWQLR